MFIRLLNKLKGCETMFTIGKIQKAYVNRMSEYGAFLSDEKNGEDEVLLPNKFVPKDIEIDQELTVFIYRDSKDRLVATTEKPKLTLGTIALLKVSQITDIGAFMDWGLEKDLLLPFREQTIKVEEGNEYMVGLYIDKSDRLCATMHTYEILSAESPYNVDDMVEGMIYSIKKDVGIFVAIDRRYHGMLPISEALRIYKRGDMIKARVVEKDEEGKLKLSLRLKPLEQIDKDSYTILKEIEKQGGFLALNDSSEPDEIRKQLSMSKKSFKKGLGRLLREEKVELKEDGISLKKL